MSIERCYWSSNEERLDIQVLFITTQPQKAPCFADADTVMVNPENGQVAIYRYSRLTHRLVDIPEVRKLTPNSLRNLLRKTLMLVVFYDEFSPFHERIISTIPFVANSRLRLSILAGIEQPSVQLSQEPSDVDRYDCVLATEQREDAFAAIRMLVEACTLQSPVSTDIADVQYALKGSGNCTVSVSSGMTASRAATLAMQQQRDVSSVRHLFCALIVNTTAELKEWSDMLQVIEPQLHDEVKFVPAFQLRDEVLEKRKFIVVAS